MTKLAATALCLLSPTVGRAAMNLGALAEIGPVASFSKSDRAVTFSCSDQSQVRVYVLAPDLVRVRAAFRKPIAETDHSWAVARTSWDMTPWSLEEGTDRFLILTDELEISVQRQPLLIEFRDPKTHRAINSDGRPMLYDPNGAAVAAVKKFGLEEHFYGLGEKAARLDKRRGGFEMWNSDTPGYGEGTDPIYQSVPFYMGWLQGAAYGIFFDNSFRGHFDFGQSDQRYSSFAAEGGEMNYYFFQGPGMKKILGRYADLTGHMPLPPRWTLGHQQSRWSYYPDALVEEIARRYREEDLPLDAVHLDIHYMNGYRVFTWDPKFFPDPLGLLSRLRQQGVKVVTIVDPGVKYQPPTKPAAATPRPELAPQDDNYYAYDQGLANGYFLKRRDGSLYIGEVWPGESVFVDYSLPAASRWWGDLHRAYLDYGVAGIWNDMNEPADFKDRTGEKQMSVVYHDAGERSTHAKNRNIFALLMAKATYEGLERLAPERRPYVITRAGYAGIQRYSTMWTGDTTSTWETLALSLPMLQTLGLSGEPFVGTDTGGFQGRSDGELLARWYQLSFLTPFCRNHKISNGNDQEPWRFGKHYEDIIRRYLKLRYRLLPFLYTVLEQAHRTGVPFFRPLLLNYQGDPSALTLDDQFMIGDDLLAAPVLAAGATARPVYLPAGSWYDYWTGARRAGGKVVRVEAPLETVPLFVRAGAIIPMGPEMNYVGEKPVDPLTLEIYPDEKGRASASWYEDDGVSPDYKKGVFRRTSVDVSRSGGAWQIALAAPQGGYDPGPRHLVFNLRTDGAVKQALLDGKVMPAAGWRQDGKALSVTIKDDGKAHRISLR